MSKQRALLISVLLLSLALAACGGGGEKKTAAGETPGASPSGGTVTIDLWHAETAGNLDTLERLIRATTPRRTRSRYSLSTRARS